MQVIRHIATFGISRLMLSNLLTLFLRLVVRVFKSFHFRHSFYHGHFLLCFYGIIGSRHDLVPARAKELKVQT
ncbi:hypothetical protein P8452_60804 [Trifolium repens]|nr:hypothetical protein P8452_60804 [Trifolium repens]